MYSSCLLREELCLQSQTTSSLFTNSSISEVMNSVGMSMLLIHFMGSSCLISKQKSCLIFSLRQSRMGSRMKPGRIDLSWPRRLIRDQREAQGESKTHPQMSYRYFVWLRKRITQNINQSTCSCPHRTSPEDEFLVATHSHVAQNYFQVPRLKVPQTDMLALGVPRTTEVEEADVPAVLDEEVQVLDAYVWCQLPSILEPLLQWQQMAQTLVGTRCWQQLILRVMSRSLTTSQSERVQLSVFLNPKSLAVQVDRQGRIKAFMKSSILTIQMQYQYSSIIYHLMLKIYLTLILCTTLASPTIVITSPLQTDFPDNEVEYMYANFGEIPYGKTLSVDLFLFENSLCNHYDVLEHFTKPTYVVIRTTIQQSCSYTKRALNAQAKGAKGIIIATQSYQYAQGSVFQGDDGNGKKVHITTLFTSNANFEKLKALKNVEIIAKYPVPKEKVSTLSLFISSAKRSSYVFLRELQAHYKSLKEFIVIEPIYHTIECEGCSASNCLFSKYCCFDYEDYTYNVGQTILKEQMHQYAIFRQRGVQQWLQYMNLFDQYCMGDWENLDPCVKKVIDTLKIKDAHIPNPEQTIVQWKVSETKLGFDTFPEVAINNMIYRGNFDSDEIIQAFCESLQSPPAYCFAENVQAEESTPGNSHLVTILLATIISVILVIILGVCVYRKFIKKELTSDMTSRVGQLVANYANRVSKQKMKQRQKLMEADVEQL